MNAAHEPQELARARSEAKAEIDTLAVALRRASDALLCAFMELNHIGLAANAPETVEYQRAAAFLQIASAEINTRLNALLRERPVEDGVSGIIRPRLIRAEGGR
jgi:hypothetical protein